MRRLGIPVVLFAAGSALVLQSCASSSPVVPLYAGAQDPHHVARVHLSREDTLRAVYDVGKYNLYNNALSAQAFAVLPGVYNIELECGEGTIPVNAVADHDYEIQTERVYYVRPDPQSFGSPSVVCRFSRITVIERPPGAIVWEWHQRKIAEGPPNEGLQLTKTRHPHADNSPHAGPRRTIWTQFAKTGVPSMSGLIDWPAYTTEGDTYLSIGPKLEGQ
jgi:hypothetical protein